MRDILLIIIALIYHECGHLLAAAIMSIPVRSINVSSVGGAITFDFSEVGYIKEALVHICGPFFGIMSGVLAYWHFGSEAYSFTGISITLAAVNLLPVSDFDGGGIVRCLLSLFFSPDLVWKICRILSVISILVLWSGILWIEFRAGWNLGLIVFIIGIMLGHIK